MSDRIHLAYCDKSWPDGSTTMHERLVTPVYCARYEYSGRMVSVSELVAMTGIPGDYLRRWILRSGSVSEAIAAWVRNGNGKKAMVRNHEHG